MPNFDGTGPQGRGPRTGRGAGRCRVAASGAASLAAQEQRLERELKAVRAELASCRKA